jgi:hypothetical protein
VAKGDKGEKGEKISVKVSEENHRRLTSLAGELQRVSGEHQTPNDAITYLFENLKKEKTQ